MEETGETASQRSVANAGDASENVSEATAEGASQMSDAAGKRSTQGDNKDAHRRSDPRLKLFNKVIEKSLQRFIDDASFHRFAQSFQPFYKDKPLMEKIHKQFTEELQKTIQGEINSLVEEADLKYKLDELDKLEQAAEDKESAWRPSGVPDQDLCCFVMPYYHKQNTYLLRELKKIRGENAALVERVQAGRDHITETSQRIATAVDEWKASVSEIQKLNSSLDRGDIFDV